MSLFAWKLIVIGILALKIDAIPVRKIEESCQDDVGFLILINQSGRYVPCSWIDSNENDVQRRRDAQCVPQRKEGVRKACPRACGDCCGDNPDFKHWFNHTTFGALSVDCDIIGSSPIYREELCPAVQLSCPGACGLCPTSAPTTSPTKTPTTSPTTKVPTPQLGGASGPTPQTGGGGGAPFPTYSKSESTETEMFFAAEIYTKDKTIQTVSSVEIMKKINEFFRREMEGYENHKIFTSLANEGIDSILVTFLAINAPFQDHLMQCGNKPDAYKKSICSTAVMSSKITYFNDSRRTRRLNNGDADIESKVENVLLKHAGAVSSMIDNVDGINLVNAASSVQSLIDTTPTISSLEEIEQAKRNRAKIIAPIVVAALVACFILGAYVVHRRRKNSIVVELEEGEGMDVEDDRLLSKKGRRNEKQSRDMRFPIETKDDDENYPVMDYICGADKDSKDYQ